MAGNYEFGIKLRYDGREVDAGVTVSRDHLRQFAADARKAGDATAGGFTTAAKGVRSISEQLAQARGAVAGYFGATQIAGGARWIVEQASAMQQLDGRIRVATNSLADYQRAQSGVFEIANRWGAAVDSTAGAFARLNPVIANMGGGAAVTLRMIDGLSASLRLSGATTGEVNAVLLQFAQAMGSGRVGGDEFRSMMESAEPLMRAVAGQLGKTTGELRQMAEEGKLTSSVFGNALLPAIDKLVQRAGEIPFGMSQAMQVLQNNLKRDFGKEFEGESNAVAGAVKTLSENTGEAARAVHALADGFVVLGQAGAVAAAAAGGAWIAKQGQAAWDAAKAINEARAARIAEAAAAVESARARSAAAAAALVEARSQQQLAAEVALYGNQRAAIERSVTSAIAAGAGARVALASAEVQLAEARAAGSVAATASAGAARLGASAMTALGGPIGLVTTLLTAGATAWLLWGGKAADGVAQAEKALGDMQKRKLYGNDPIIAQLRTEIAAYQQLQEDMKDAVDKGGAWSESDDRKYQAEIDRRQALVRKMEEAARAAADVPAPATASDGKLSAAGNFGKLTEALKWREKVLADHAVALSNLGQTIADRYSDAVKKGASAGDLAKIVRENAAAMRALLRDQGEELKNLPDAKLGRAINDAQLDVLAERARARAKSIVADITREYEQGRLSTSAYIQQTHAAEADQIAAQIALLERRRGGADGAELVRIGGQIETLKTQLAEIPKSIGAAEAEARKKFDDLLSGLEADAGKHLAPLEAAALEFGRKYRGAIAEAVRPGGEELAEPLRQIWANLADQAQFDAAKRQYDALFAEMRAGIEQVRAAAREDGGLLNALAGDNEVQAWIARYEARLAALRAKLAEHSVDNPDRQKDVANAGREMLKVVEESSTATRKFVDDLQRGLTDSLYRSFERGETAGRAMIDGIKNYAKTAGIKIGAQLVVDVPMGMARNALGLGGGTTDTLGAVGQAGNLAQGASNMYSLATGGLTSASAGFVASQTGAALGLSTATNYGMITSYTATAAGTALNALATAAPWIAAIALAASVFSKKGGPKSGGDAVYALADGRASLQADRADERYGGFFTPAGDNAKMAEAFKPVAATLAQTIQRLTGSNARLGTVGIGYDTDPQGTAGSRISSRVTDAAGNILYHNSIDAGRDEAALQREMTAEMSRVALASIRAADIPGKVGEFLRSSMSGTVDGIAALTKEQADALASAATSGWLPTLLNSLDASAVGFAGVADRAADLAGKLPVLQAQYGLTADSIGNAVAAIANAPSAAQAGANFAGLVTNSIYDAMQGQYAGSITSLVMGEVVNPMLAALALGGDAATALSDDIIAAAVGKADALADAYSALMGSEAFTGALARVQSAMSHVGAAAWVAQPARYQVPDYSAAASTRDTSADDGLRASQSLIDGIRDRAAGVRDTIAKMGMGEYQAALYDLGTEYRSQQAEIAKLTVGQVEATAALDDWRAAQQQWIDMQAAQKTTDYIAEMQAGAISAGDALGRIGLDDFAGQMYDLDIWYRQQTDAIALLTTGQEAATAAMQASYWAQRQVIEASAQWAEEQRVSATLRDMAKEGRQLGAELLDAQGKSAEAKAAIRALAIEGFTEAQIAAYDANAALREQITAERKLKDERSGLTATLRELLGDLAGSRADQLAALEPGARGLQQTVWTLQDASGAVDAALGAVQRSIDAEKSRIQDAATAQADSLRGQIDAMQSATATASDAVGALKSIMDAASGGARTLRGQVEATAQMQMAEARAYINMALSLARIGERPDDKRLADAISTVTADKPERYATRQAWEEAQARQANKLAEIAALTGAQGDIATATLKANEAQVKAIEDQIKSAEKASAAQIRVLDNQLKAAQTQVDVMRGVDTSIQGVGAAVAGLQAALQGLAGARATAGAGAGIAGTLPTAVPSSGAAGGGYAAALVSAANYASNSGYSHLQDTGAIAAELRGLAQDAAGLSQGWIDNKVAQIAADAAAYAGMSGGDVERLARSLGVPGFAAGGLHSGGLRLVGERGPELEITGPARYLDAGMTRRMLRGDDLSGTLRALIDEVGKLRAEVAKLKGAADRTADNTGKTKDALTRVTTTSGGKPALLTAVAA